MQYDMRNGPIRKKFDALKYTLRKLEVRMVDVGMHAQSGLFCHCESGLSLGISQTLLYELSLARAGAPARRNSQVTILPAQLNLFAQIAEGACNIFFCGWDVPDR